MADEQNDGNSSSRNTDLSALVIERDKLRDELNGAKARIKEINGEAAGHRLNAERLGKLADERAAQIEAAKAEAAAARAEVAAAVEAVRTEGVTALNALRDDLTGKMTAAEKASAERVTAFKERVTTADLRLAAKDAGMSDLDGLKMLDPATLKIGDDGSVTNAAEVIGAFKTAKPWVFGQTSTSATTTTAPPPPANDKAKKFDDMTPAEQGEWKRSQGLR